MRQNSRLRKIIIGVDGSDASLEALRLGRSLAEPVNAQIEVITCWTYPQVFGKYIMDGFEIYKETAAKVLDQSVSRVFGPELPRDVRTRLVEGNAKVSLIEASGGADMLILGRRGSGGFSGLHIGSVSSSCVAHAECPVLVVPAPDSRESD
ncbi:universal stress protein [Arthrobacter sulfonylureivorans]|uniref:Universal stress protein n=1 Tax=Arthrobacter sulfonylureivorans TaxID=2486855 RepID=A0ABY3W2M3_9MICC|nr:universal stress protein [Arthrobacter sulfonylureivorans]UNK44263.1 universal stress protein [Arthrobacter sulfonylureivorans]